MSKPPAPHTSHPKAPEKLGRSPGEVSREPLPALPSAPRWLPSPARAGYLRMRAALTAAASHPKNTLRTPSPPLSPRTPAAAWGQPGGRCRPLRGSPSCACRDRRDREGDGVPRHVWHGMSGVSTWPHTRDAELRGTPRVFARPRLSLPLRACKARVPPVRAGTPAQVCRGTRWRDVGTLGQTHRALWEALYSVPETSPGFMATLTSVPSRGAHL